MKKKKIFYERRTVGRVVFGRALIYYNVIRRGSGEFFAGSERHRLVPLQIFANNCHYIIIIIIIIIISIIGNIIVVDSIRVHNNTALCDNRIYDIKLYCTTPVA